jgi:hypothetical protein
MRYTYTKSNNNIRLESIQCGKHTLDTLKLAASKWYNGQTDPLYAFVSTGTVTRGLEQAARDRAYMAHCDGLIEDQIALSALAHIAEAVREDGRFCEPNTAQD